MDTLYTSKGEAIAYVDDDEQSIYLFNSKPVAWLSNERGYTYKGTYLGWYQAGRIDDGSAVPLCLPPERQVDLQGRCVESVLFGACASLGRHEVLAKWHTLVRHAECLGQLFRVSNSLSGRIPYPFVWWARLGSLPVPPHTR